MKWIIDVDEKLVCEGFVRNFTEEERDILIRAIRNSIPYEEKPKYFPPCEDCNKKMEEIRQAYDKMKVMKRPQGAWIKITNDGIMPIEYMCNICGRTVKSYYEEYLIEKVYPFCHCGADMRGTE